MAVAFQAKRAVCALCARRERSKERFVRRQSAWDAAGTLCECRVYFVTYKDVVRALTGRFHGLKHYSQRLTARREIF